MAKNEENNIAYEATSSYQNAAHFYHNLTLWGAFETGLKS